MWRKEQVKEASTPSSAQIAPVADEDIVHDDGDQDRDAVVLTPAAVTSVTPWPQDQIGAKLGTANSPGPMFGSHGRGCRYGKSWPCTGHALRG